MYNAKYFLVANLLNPYAVSSRNKLKTKAGSSANHYLQNEDPGKDEEFNWLPAPANKLILLRLGNQVSAQKAPRSSQRYSIRNR